MSEVEIKKPANLGEDLKNYDKLMLILKDFKVLRDLKTLKVAKTIHVSKKYQEYSFWPVYPLIQFVSSKLPNALFVYGSTVPISSLHSWSEKAYVLLISASTETVLASALCNVYHHLGSLLASIPSRHGPTYFPDLPPWPWLTLSSFLLLFLPPSFLLTCLSLVF